MSHKYSVNEKVVVTTLNAEYNIGIIKAIHLMHRRRSRKEDGIDGEPTGEEYVDEVYEVDTFDKKPTIYVEFELMPLKNEKLFDITSTLEKM